MTVRIETLQSANAHTWDAYVHNHPQGTLYHLSGWKNIIEKTYGHKTYYLMAVDSSKLKAQSSKENSIIVNKLSINSCELDSNRVVGILPLVHLKHFLFGNTVLSIPFFDMSGILAEDEEAEMTLLSEVINLGRKLKVKTIELRHAQPLACLSHSKQASIDDPQNTHLSFDLSALSYITKSHKVRMLLDLPESSNLLMKSFKSKLRSQIKKPIKEGLSAKIGGGELLDDFYKVFTVNMRDLGSPVHSKRLMRNVLLEFPDKSGVVMVYKDDLPIACSMIVGFRDTLENPWASSLREYSKMSPNMLLYWTMLKYACDNGYKYFDFGRSSPEEGTYRFKEQWGAKPQPLHWHSISLNGKPISEDTDEKSEFDKAIQYWQKLPVPVTKVIGPMIRKHIGL